MKLKLAIAIGVVFGLVAFCLGHYGLYWFLFRAPTVLSTNSPRNAYSVVLNGRSDRAWFLKHTVWFTAKKQNDVLISQRFLHSAGDAFDPAYYILYPQHAWPSENVLHLYNEYYLGGSVGTVAVTNNSDVTIKYMLVKATDAHLLFELKPGTTTTLQIPPPRGDWEWFYIEWMDETGSVIKEAWQSFRQDRKQPSRCFIDIGEQGASIDCPDLKKKYVKEDR
jgi:hypothetical protein